MFVVRVPVLSLQMTVVHPNVSTEGRDLTMAFRRAILLVPRAKHVVTTAGRPSGMAATARATATYQKKETLAFKKKAAVHIL
jgi:hypothetical protein